MESQPETIVSKDELRKGQKVLYHPVGGGQQVTEGIIKDIITEPEVIL